MCSFFFQFRIQMLLGIHFNTVPCFQDVLLCGIGALIQCTIWL